MNFFKDTLTVGVQNKNDSPNRKLQRKSPKDFEIILQLEKISDCFAEFVVSYDAIAFLDLLHLTHSYKKPNLEKSKKKTIGDRIMKTYLHSELYEKDFFLSEEELQETMELFEKEDPNCFKSLEYGVTSVLRYLFIRFRQTDTWMKYAQANYNDQPLFQELYKSVKGKSLNLQRVKDKKKLDSFLVQKFEKLTKEELNEETKKFQNLKEIATKCDNLVQCVDIFAEEEEKGDLFELFLVVKEFSMNLNKFIEEESTERSCLSNYVLLTFMVQLIESLMSLHETNFYFPIGELTEERIYLNLMCSELYLDTGFIKIELNPKFKIIPPEFKSEKFEKKSSKLSDTFSLGIIFLRLITFLSIESISNIFQNDEMNSPKSSKSKILFQKKKKDKFGDFSSSYNIQSFNDIETKLFTEIEKCSAHDEIKKIVFDMVRSNEKRPKLKDTLIKLKTLKGVLEKQDVDGIISNYLLNNNLSPKPTEKIESKNEMKITDIDSTSKIKKTESSFSLIGFLSDPDLRPYFQTFLVSEFAQEPLLFVIVVEKYKLQKENRNDLVLQIYDDYINSSTAKFEINVTHKLKKLFAKDMNRQINENKFQDDLFDGLLNHVVGRSLQEPFLRFKNSEKFKELRKKYL
eukprot:gene3691-6505_t